MPLDELVRGRVALSIRRHEPVGAVAAITPYNAALLMALQKLVPALMAGNSVIVRPSPLTPLSSLALGAAADEAGLPPGVLSVIVESGSAGAGCSARTRWSTWSRSRARPPSASGSSPRPRPR